jgi:peroxiredoxin
VADLFYMEAKMLSRKSPLKLVVLVSIVLAAQSAARALADEPASPAGHRPMVGEKAEDFALDTLDGKTVRLNELIHNGPVVVLMLRGWVGYQCPICTRQVADLRAHAKQLADAGAQVVLVYPGPPDGLKQHAEEFISGKGLPTGFFFVLDPRMQLVADWDLRCNAPNETAYPSTFVIDPTGVVRFAKVSTSHGGRATAKEILAALPASSK